MKGKGLECHQLSECVGHGGLSTVTPIRMAMPLASFSPRRDQQATKCFLIKAIHRHDVLSSITIDESVGTAAVIEWDHTARVGGN